MKLSNRLQSIYDMVPYGIAADIGADHGKLIINLVENGKILKGYAIENKKGPYSRLLNAINESQSKEKVVALFSDGLNDIPLEVNILVFAGMGGDNIIDIIKKNITKLKNIEYILTAANSSNDKVRKFICDNGFSIAEEKIVLDDGIYYQIIKFIKSDKAIYSSEDYEFGPLLRQEKSILFKKMYEQRIKKIRQITNDNSIPEKRMLELKKEEERIKSQL
ncbi:MAG: tRNA (adenine(22)-N(1))-methyltransferase [Bacilli bacterium]